MKDIVLVGFGGHAKSVSDSIERVGDYRIVGYTDIEERQSEYDYLGTDEALLSIYESGVKYAAVGIGYLGAGNIRETIYNNLKDVGFILPVIIDPSAVVSRKAEIGEGTFIGKLAVVNCDAKIGKMAIINTKALIEHECEVGDYTHIAVATTLCGQVKIGKASFIGAGSTIIQCRELNDKSIIPAGITYR